MKFLQLRFWNVLANKENYSLSSLDPVYQKVFKNRTTVDRLDYCESLLFRTKEDLKRSKSSKIKKNLELLIQTTMKEIKCIRKVKIQD